MESVQNKKRHPVRNALLIILLILLSAVAAVLFIFGDELMLLYRGLTTTAEAIESQRIENDKKTNELLDRLTVEGTMRDLTDEERAMLNSGELSREEALALIKGETKPAETTVVIPDNTTAISDAATSSDAPADTTEAADNEQSDVPKTTEPSVQATAPPKQTEKPQVTTSTAATTEKPAAPEDSEALYARIDEIIAEIYLLRATYLNEIDTLIKNTKAEYIALPKEQHNLTGKMRLVERMIPKGNALEAQCDASMEALLTELKDILDKLSLDTDIIDEIKATYAEQKEIKKTELYNQYSHHLK